MARYRFSIYLAYAGHGICIVVGIAPTEPGERGIVPSDGLKVMEQNHKWQNPLRLALGYQTLLENGKTKADIARMMGSSRARVTQIMSLLELHPDIQKYLNDTKNDLDAKLLTERKLRGIAAIRSSEDQLATFHELISPNQI
ncbi:hypothetical protein ACFL6S_16635 [Candidatus Poribacteria bacterium]